MVTIQIPKNELTDFLVREFGTENIANYAETPLPTVVLKGTGVYGNQLRRLNKIGWSIAGIHATGILQIGFKN